MKAKRYLLAALIGLAFGYASGHLGTVIMHYNESHFGGSSRSFRFDWLGIPSLPGEIIAEWRAGYDWGIDEAWTFRSQIRTANAVFWSLFTVVALPLTSLFRFRAFRRRNV